MFEKTFRNLALKIAAVAKQVSVSAENVSTSWAKKAVASQEAARLKALRNPTITFIREMKQGRHTVSFYEHRDATGRTTRYFALSRETSDGRVRLATGKFSELSTHHSSSHRRVRDIIQSHSARREANRDHRQANRAPERPEKNAHRTAQNTGQPRHAARRRHEARQPPRGEDVRRNQPRHTDGQKEHRPGQQGGPHEVRKPRQVRPEAGTGPPREQPPRQAVAAPQRAEGPKKLWYVLVFVESLNPDGSGNARVVRCCDNLDAALALRKSNPSLTFLGKMADRPLKQGTLLNVTRENSRAIAYQLNQLAKQEPQPLTNGLDQGQRQPRKLEHTQKPTQSQGM